MGGYQNDERENETAICLWDALSRSQQCAYSGGDRGEWRPGYVTGTFTRAAGAQPPISGIVLDAHGPRVNGYLFLSDRLAAHWPMLDDFEEGTIGCRWK
nr:Uncharacterised protein [Klebsiella pneumoniae]